MTNLFVRRQTEDADSQIAWIWENGHRVIPVLALLLLSLSGCHGVGQFAGVPLPDTNQRFFWRDKQSLWNDWAHNNLQSGDLLFVSGESRILMGLVDFSKLCREVAESDFSHIALVSREHDELVVYDAVLGGARRTPFGQFVADRRVWKIAVKRLQPEQQRFVPGAIAYCRQAYESKTEFDRDFRLNNDRLYCTELIELAFRHAGLPLSEPIRIDQLPGYDDVNEPTRRLVLAATSLENDQELLLPGNDTIGIWANPHLDLVLDLTDVSSPPRPWQVDIETSGGRGPCRTEVEYAVQQDLRPSGSIQALRD